MKDPAYYSLTISTRLLSLLHLHSQIVKYFLSLSEHQYIYLNVVSFDVVCDWVFKESFSPLPFGRKKPWQYVTISPFENNVLPKQWFKKILTRIRSYIEKDVNTTRIFSVSFRYCFSIFCTHKSAISSYAFFTIP